MRNVQLVALMGLVSAVACDSSIPTDIVEIVTPVHFTRQVDPAATRGLPECEPGVLECITHAEVEAQIFNNCTQEFVTLTGKILIRRHLSGNGTSFRQFINISNLMGVGSDGTEYVARSSSTLAIELLDTGQESRVEERVTLISKGPAPNLHTLLVIEMRPGEDPEITFEIRPESCL